MLMRKTQYAWMALGGLICLLGLVLACKLRDGNKAIAQPEKMDLPPLLTSTDDNRLSSPPPSMPKKTPSSSPSLPPFLKTEPEKVPPPKAKKTKNTEWEDKPSEPKATLNMPFPAEPSTMPMHSLTETPAPPPTTSTAPPPVIPGTVMPASFGPNTPMPTEPKTTEPLPPSHKTDKLQSSPGAGKEPSNPVTPSELLNGKQTPSELLNTKHSSVEEKKPETSSLPKSTPASEKPKAPEKKSDTSVPPSWNAPVTVTSPRDGTVTTPKDVPPSEHETVKTQPGEPPLAPAPGPVQLYHVHRRETLQDIAQRTLGSNERWGDLHKLNPTLKPDEPLSAGTTVRLPADACVQSDDAEGVKPLPALRRKPAAPKAKVLPLTGTYQCSIDSKGRLTLPRALRDQFDGSDTILLSPGPDKCLWLTNQPHLERLGERLDQSQANEADVRVFKRLYFAQTEKLSVNADGRVTIPERLSEFAELQQEVVLVGIDDHFEVWDAARWRAYTQQKSGGRAAALAEQE
ncbi:MAG TPA: hypothetical protein VMG10_26970 [Gemmataceae bacterium]|nr:hypothetical protein [Gemmataceae bacterium]